MTSPSSKGKGGWVNHWKKIVLLFIGHYHLELRADKKTIAHKTWCYFQWWFDGIKPFPKTVLVPSKIKLLNMNINIYFGNFQRKFSKKRIHWLKSLVAKKFETWHSRSEFFCHWVSLTLKMCFSVNQIDDLPSMY